MNMNVLVTGATGFAGSFLVQHLFRRGKKVYGTYLINRSLASLPFLPKQAKLFKLDLLNGKQTEEAIKQIKPAQIYHLAALSLPSASFGQPKETIINNAVAQINLLETVKKLKLNAKVLIIGSADEYGIVSDRDIPISEKTPLNPTSPYSVSKITQDYLALQYFNSYRLRIYRARPFNHIGPRQQEGFVVPSFCRQIARIEKKKQRAIIKVGNLTPIRDFTDVRDMVIAYELLLEKGQAGTVYNIGSGIGYSIGEILNKLLGLSRVKIKIQPEADLFRPVENPKIIAENQLFRQTTKWENKIPLEKTLADTLEYWRQTV